MPKDTALSILQTAGVNSEKILEGLLENRIEAEAGVEKINEEIRAEEMHFRENVNRIGKDVRTGKISLGNPFLDYAIVSNPLSTPEDLKKVFFMEKVLRKVDAELCAAKGHPVLLRDYRMGHAYSYVFCIAIIRGGLEAVIRQEDSPYGVPTEECRINVGGKCVTLEGRSDWVTLDLTSPVAHDVNPLIDGGCKGMLLPRQLFSFTQTVSTLITKSADASGEFSLTEATETWSHLWQTGPKLKEQFAKIPPEQLKQIADALGITTEQLLP